ncbi:putative ribonuclease H-like domain-containing protein [Tanacetum coccineum]
MLKVSPRKGVIRFEKRGKLNPQNIGPFKILKRIGPVAYKLELPEELSNVHSTFYISNLKKCLSDESFVIPMKELRLDDKLNFVEEPMEIMDREVKQLKQSRIPIVKGKPQQDDTGFVDSGCSMHMTGNIDYLSGFHLMEVMLHLEEVHMVVELLMCDKKNYVLFTDTECLVLSPNFKLPDENQILLKIPRKDNMYSFDMKNIVPKESLTCLVAKATLDESMLWHRRLGHINFKNINKLVKDNLVRGLPTKHFENDQTCVACLKGKQHRASCKSKVLNPITKPLFMLHMDLFGPTFVSSLMHKKYCLVVTDDYSRFTWVFFLTTKDETSEILKNFIKEIENLVDKKVKIIRSDNGTEFKNKVMDDFCREKADSKLPTTFWVEVVSTACYVQNRVLVVKPHNKTPYELFRGFKPALSFMRPFGCHVTIINTLDSLGKFDGKSNEGFFVGYSLSSKAFRVYNTRTRRVKENLHIGVLENKPIIEGNYPKWLFDIDSLTQSMNYVLVTADTSYFDSPTKNVENGEPKTTDDAQNHDVNTGSLKLNVVGLSVNTASSNEQDITEDEPEVDLGNITNSYIVPTTPNTRIHKDYPIDNVIGEVKSTVQTRRMTKPTSEQGFLSDIEPTSIAKALSDSSWVEAMQEELLQFKLQQLKFERKFNYSDVKSALTPIDLEKPLVKDGDADDVDVHLYRSMIRSLMYLTASWPDIMFAAWYSRDSPFELVAYTDSDYAGATLDRKSITGGCQFLGNRLISWQCKSKTVVATSTTEAEYVAAASCCRQVSDEAVHKELGDKMERAATTASSLEAKQDSGSGPRCQDTILGDVNAQTRFKLVLSLFVYAVERMLMLSVQVSVVEVNPVIYTSCIEQFWETARRDLHLNDAEGTDCLPTATIFEELTRMSGKSTASNEFSSSMASLIICLATNQKFNLSKYIFDAW